MSKDANGYGSDTILTDKIADDLTHAFQVGAVIEDAAAYAGISKRCLERWLTRGRRGDEPYKALVERLEQARGHGLVTSLTMMATSEDWRAHRALAAMRRPEYAEQRFFRGEVKHTHTLDLAGWPTEDVEALAAMMERNGVPRGDVIEDAEVLELEPSQDTT